MDEVTRQALALAWEEGFSEGWANAQSTNPHEVENPYSRKKDS